MKSTIEKQVSRLAHKYEFDLCHPGRALWVKNPASEQGNLDDLMICVYQREGRYLVGQARPDRTGFCVYYSLSWQPLRAFSDYGCPIRDLASADKEMCKLVGKFLSSTKARVTWLADDG